MVGIGALIWRDGLQVSAQLRKVILLDILAECVDLAHEGARDVLPGATELLALLETVRDEACSSRPTSRSLYAPSTSKRTGSETMSRQQSH